MNYFDFYESPMGRMLIVASEDALSGLYFVGQKYYPELDDNWLPGAKRAPVRETACQMKEYFAGKRREFDVPLAPEGTCFQTAVWDAIASVEYGATITYAELARRAGRPESVRAAGTATGRNPITIIIPCHRIIGSDGSLTGYAGGLERKRELQDLESGARSLFASNSHRAQG
ncbi:MAG: methylated-DNA--[protein]-cysteine S-methyltransferase [Candidatus Binataceae bacterium]